MRNKKTTITSGFGDALRCSPIDCRSECCERPRAISEIVSCAGHISPRKLILRLARLSQLICVILSNTIKREVKVGLLKVISAADTIKLINGSQFRNNYQKWEAIVPMGRKQRKIDIY